MNTFKKILLAACVSCSCSVYADVAIIVHPSNNDSLDQEMISKIFLGKTSGFPTAGKAVPLDLSENEIIKEEFLNKVLKKNKSQYNAYWAKLLFTGSGTPPKEIESQQGVIDLVKNNPNIIGYVDASKVTPDVKVVATF